MKALVTGANGFLAGHVIRELSAMNCSVRAMIRPGSKIYGIEGDTVEIFRGHITDPEDADRAVQGCDYVIHIAADTSQSHLRIIDYYPTNVKATILLQKAAGKHQCKRFVFVSSANTIGFGSDEQPGTEKNPPSGIFLRSGYAKSKLLAERRLLRNRNCNVVVLNPTFMIGPEDYNPHSGKIFSFILNRFIAFYPPGGKNFVDVRDVARGVVEAMSKGRSGERYILSGENLSYRQFYRRVKHANRQHTILLPLPQFLLYTLGFMGSVLRFTGLRISLSFTNSKILCVRNFYSNGRATRELGISFRELSETINDFISWRRIHLSRPIQ